MLNMRTRTCQTPQGTLGRWGADNSIASSVEDWQRREAVMAAGGGQLGATPAECPSSIWHFIGGAVFWAFAGGIVLRLLGVGQKAAQRGVLQLERHVQSSSPSAMGAAAERRRSREESQKSPTTTVCRGCGQNIYVAHGPKDSLYGYCPKCETTTEVSSRRSERSREVAPPSRKARSREVTRRGGKNAIDKEVERIYYRHGQNVQINVMDIGKIFAAGRAAHAAGQPMEPAIVDAIAKYRANERSHRRYGRSWRR